MSRRILLLCVAVAAVAQQVEPVYRTGARLVQVDVVVRSDKGPVAGLTKDDFTIQDKGKPQTIAVFAMNEKGGDAGKGTPLPPNVGSNRMNANGEIPKTATVILFDRLNILEPSQSNANSALAVGAQARAGKQVMELLASLKPADKVGLYSLSDNLTVVSDFSEDCAPMIEAAKRAIASPQQNGTTPAEKAMDTKLRDALTPGHTIEEAARAQITQSMFREVARRMDGVPGRKSLIWIASSFPLTYGNDNSRKTDSQAEINQVAYELGEANVAMYSVDPRGTGTGYGTPAGGSTDSSTGAGGGGGGGGRGTKGGASMTKMDTTVDSTSGFAGPEVMDQIASQTGGKSYISVNEIAGPIREAMASANVSYTLGFYVDDKALDGRKHDISVKLSKKAESSGGKASYRKSYMAVARPQRAQMNELVTDRLDANRIGVMAAAVAMPDRPGVDAVQVHVDLKDLQFEKRADKWVTSFDLALAIEGSGEPKVSVGPNNLSLSDDQLKQGLEGGVTINNTVPAPDKAATMRIVVQDKATGEAGSVRIPLPGK